MRPERGATWFVAEGAEEVKGASSMPIAKAMDDCLVAYGMNGEAVRPQQGSGAADGSRLRRDLPHQVAAAHRGGRPLLHELQRLRHVDRDPKVAALDYQIGPKSVITFPSGAQQLPGRGFYEISGLAWSGGGAIKKVEVSTDGGKRWNSAEIKGTAQRMAHTRFGYMWNWDGQETELQSRCTDELGQEPSREESPGTRTGPSMRRSACRVSTTAFSRGDRSDGSVTNGFA